MHKVFKLPEMIDRHHKLREPWFEFLRVSALSLGIYSLPAGSEDPQFSHPEDVVYYILAGRAVLKVENENRVAEPGRSSTSARTRTTASTTFKTISRVLCSSPKGLHRRSEDPAGAIAAERSLDLLSRSASSRGPRAHHRRLLIRSITSTDSERRDGRLAQPILRRALEMRRRRLVELDARRRLRPRSPPCWCGTARQSCGSSTTGSTRGRASA